MRKTVLTLATLLIAGWAFAQHSLFEAKDFSAKKNTIIEKSEDIQDYTYVPSKTNQKGKSNLNEGFEGTTFPPEGWKVINGGGANTWVRYTTTPISGTASASILYNATAHNDWLITPPLVPEEGNNTISFWAKNGGSTYLDEFNVKLSITGNNEEDFTITLASNIAPPTTATEYSYDLSAYNGQKIYVAVQAISTDKLRLYVDDFTGPALWATPFDAGISSIVNPIGLKEPGLYDVVVTLRNFGAEELTAVDIDWEVVSPLPVKSGTGTFAWTGTLAPAETVDVTIVEDFDFTDYGEYTITATTDLLDDGDPTNDEATAAVLVADFCPYTVMLVDSYGDGWDGTVLGFKQNGEIVGTFGQGFTSGGSFGPVSVSLIHDIETEIVVVTLGSFTGEKGFTVYDPFGNVVYHRDPGTTFTIATIFHTFTTNCEAPQNDAVAVSVNMSPFTGTGLAAEVVGTVKNAGELANPFDVTVVITDGDDVEVFTATETLTVPSFEEQVVNFGEWTPDVAGVYTVTLTVELTDDENTDNDVVTLEVEVIDNLLWGYNIDYTSSTNGIISTNYGDIEPNGLVESADDFILPEGEWVITSINPRGFQSAGSLVGFRVIIYSDNDGEPGDVLFEEMVETTEAVAPILTFEEPLVLEGGHYWLMVAGHYPTASALTQGRWNWYTWNKVTENEAALRDNPDLFEGGFTTWNPLSALGVSGAGSTDFAIFGIPYVAPVTYTLTVEVAPEGAGLVNGEVSWELELEEDAELTLTAVANEGFAFVNWTIAGEEVGDEATLVFVMPAEDVDLVANFEEVVPELHYFLSWEVAPTASTETYRAEHYAVLISTTGTDPEDFTIVFEETLLTTHPQWEYQVREIAIDDLAGENIYVAFRHYDVTDMDRISIDNVKVYMVDADEVETVIFFEDFQGGVPEGDDPVNEEWLPEGWFAVDADEDGFNWYFGVRNDNGAMRSQSWDEVALTPDNWLFTPSIFVGEVIIETYTVTFVVSDTEGFVEGATVTFDGDNYTTDAAGEVVIADVVAGTYAYTVSKDNYETVSASVEVDADVTVPVLLTPSGVGNNILSNLTAYPNPFSDKISITNAEMVKQVIVTNLIGQRVMVVNLNGEETINTSNLSVGVYLVTFEGINGDRVVRKMVKQ